MVGEGVGQAEHAGQLGAEERGAEQPHLGEVATARNGRRVARRSLAREEISDQFDHVVGKCVGVHVLGASQRSGGDLVRAGGPPKPEVDPARVQSFERAELLGHHERGVVGEHDAARTDPQRRGGVRPGGR